jgi:hypothetical protein
MGGASRGRKFAATQRLGAGSLSVRRGVAVGVRLTGRCSVRQVASTEHRRLQDDESRRRVAEDVSSEATPVALVGPQIASSPAARTVRVEGPYLGCSPRRNLQYLAPVEVTRVHDERDAWIALDQGSELRPSPGQPPERLLFPQVPERANRRPRRPIVATRARSGRPKKRARSKPSSTAQFSLTPPSIMYRWCQRGIVRWPREGKNALRTFGADATRARVMFAARPGRHQHRNNPARVGVVRGWRAPR